MNSGRRFGLPWGCKLCRSSAVTNVAASQRGLLLQQVMTSFTGRGDTADFAASASSALMFTTLAPLAEACEKAKSESQRS
jgi:hypothetical protein